jgi:PadR family transcriptional regulator PadR
VDESRELLKGNTPTLVLAVLMEGPQHTYALGHAIASRVGDAVQFKRGTLYPVLHALEREGLVTGEWEHEEGERPRRTYTITPSGREEFARRAERWNRFAEAMNRLIGGSPHEQTA